MKSITRFISTELYTIFKLVTPIYISTLATQTLSIVALIFVGHLGNGSAALAAVSLCQVFVDITGYYLHFAIASALDTLASQTHGAKNFKHIGVILQRSILIHLSLSIPISMFWLNMGNILVLIKQPHEIVSIANQYMLIAIAINPAYALLIPCIKILQMQDIVLPSSVIVVLGNVVEIVLCYCLAYRAELGVSGIALSQVLTAYLMALAHLFYLRFSRVWGRIWGGMSWEGWNRWGQYIYYGIPELVMILIEIPCIQVGGFVVGIVSPQPEIDISIYSILTYLDLFVFMMSISMSTISAIRVGNLVGEDNFGYAKKVSALIVILQIIFSLIQSTMLMIGKSIWGRLFTSDERVVIGLSNIVFIVAIYHPFDSLVVVFQGILRGVGKQDLSLITSLGFSLVAFPVSMILSVGLKMSTLGYFLGIMTGYLVRVVLWLIIPFCCIKWKNIKKVDNIDCEENDNVTISDELQENTNLIGDASPNTDNYLELSVKRKFRLLWSKILIIFVFLVFFLLQLSCRLGSKRINLNVTDSYLEEQIEMCCFQITPLTNLTKILKD